MSLALPVAMRDPTLTFRPLGPATRKRPTEPDAGLLRAEALAAFRYVNHGDADSGCVQEFGLDDDDCGFTIGVDRGVLGGDMTAIKPWKLWQVEPTPLNKACMVEHIERAVAMLDANALTPSRALQAATEYAREQMSRAWFHGDFPATPEPKTATGLQMLAQAAQKPQAAIAAAFRPVIPLTDAEVKQYANKMKAGKMTAAECEDYERRLRARRRVKEFARN